MRLARAEFVVGKMPFRLVETDDCGNDWFIFSHRQTFFLATLFSRVLVCGYEENNWSGVVTGLWFWCASRWLRTKWWMNRMIAEIWKVWKYWMSWDLKENFLENWPKRSLWWFPRTFNSFSSSQHRWKIIYFLEKLERTK